MNDNKRRGAPWTLALLVLTFAVLGPIGEAQAQQAPDPPAAPPWKDSRLPLDGALHRAMAFASSGAPAADARRFLARLGLRLDAEDRIQVEIEGPPGSVVPAAALGKLGVRLDSTWRGTTEAWVRADKLAEAAAALPLGFTLRRPRPMVPEAVAGEGPVVTGSAGHRDNGLAGQGLTVAVIDGCYNRLSEARANGDIPPIAATTEINYTSGDFQALVEDWDEHGTACTEALYDHLPAARYRLYKFDSIADVGVAVDDAIAHGVDIISLSVAYFNQGWDDDSGAICAAMNEAARAGILVFVAAGNYATDHWQGRFDPGPDADNRHDWVSGDETIDIKVPADGEITAALSWNTSGDVYNYDLILYDTNISTVLASGTDGGNEYEWVYWKNETGGERTVHAVVTRVSGGLTDMELFVLDDASMLQYAVAFSSTASPSNATHPNVVSVGAVGWKDYGSPSGATGIIRNYSSQGPSNSGMFLPDVAGPTSVTTFVRPAGFGGTSCATPNAAGTAGALWSCGPNEKASAVRDLLFRWAQEGRDWGEFGHDNVYGRGGINLPPFADCNTNGTGDTCDIVRGDSRDCDDDATPDDCEIDTDGDGVIDVCDACDDLDLDGYGAPGHRSCRLGREADCDDANALLSPGTIEICDTVDTDCSGVADDHVCRGFDLDHSGTIDGVELAWLARAFGLCSATPDIEWWGRVDFDRSTCVDGPDLSILGSAGVWAKTTDGCAYTCPPPTGR